MPSIGQENLETVMIDFFGALRRGDFEAAAGLLDPDVSWQGLREEWVCHGHQEVVDTFRWGLEQRREIDALEFTRAGEQVVLGARGPNIGPEEEPLGQIFNVFTLRDGRIVRIDDYRGRREALTAAGVAENADWRGSAAGYGNPVVSSRRATLRDSAVWYWFRSARRLPRVAACVVCVCVPGATSRL